MKQTLTIAFMLVCATISAQDTTCVMVTQTEIINFNFQTSEILDRYPNDGGVQLKVDESEVLCLHLFDQKNRFRDVTFNIVGMVTDFGQNDPTVNSCFICHNTFNSNDNTTYTGKGWGSFTVDVSKARRKE